MYKPTDPQRTIFEVDHRLPENIRRMLRGTWAEGFAAKIFPILLNMESELGNLYCLNNGRPNWSVARMLGLSILQEMHNFSDQDALNCFSFDVRWQYALGVEPEHAYLSRRSLIDFRSRMVQRDPEMKMLRSVFNRIGDAAIADLKISTDDQRLDSTRIQSNIFTCGRIDLFSKTLFNFVRWLKQNFPDKINTLSKETQQWFAKYDDDGWFGHAFRLSKEKKRARLQQLAEYLYEARVTFKSDEEVKDGKPYLLVCRLLDEHCKVKSSDDDGDDNGPGKDDASKDPIVPKAPKSTKAPKTTKAPQERQKTEGATEDSKEPNGNNCETTKNADSSDGTESEIQVLKKVKNPSTSMQSPYDPDAGYSGHKGEGYFVHVTETCNNDTKEIITDYFVKPAGIDMNQDQKAIENLRAAGKQPKRLAEDGGYLSSAGLMAAKEMGTELIAPVSVKNQPKDAICRDQFQYDAQGNCTACPAGHSPIRHGMRTSSSKPEQALHVFFDAEICSQCDLKERCMVRPPNNGKGKVNHIEIDPALVEKDRLKAQQSNIEWWEKYKIRAGIEATMSELSRVNGIKHLRVRGKPRVTLAVSLKVTACNTKRWIAASSIGNSGDCSPSHSGEGGENRPDNGDAIHFLLLFAATVLCDVLCHHTQKRYMSAIYAG